LLNPVERSVSQQFRFVAAAPGKQPHKPGVDLDVPSGALVQDLSGTQIRFGLVTAQEGKKRFLNTPLTPFPFTG
jgi:hypothetical protein